MNIEIIIYSIFIILILSLLIFISISLIINREYETKFYKYKIKYDSNLDRNYSMIKIQKRIIFKKKLELFYIKLLIFLKVR